MAGRPRKETYWFDAQRFIYLREGNGYQTQSDLAADIHIDQRQISNWETHASDPSADQLVKISQFFKVSIDYLLGQSNDPTLHRIEDNQGLKDRLFDIVTPENIPELLERIALILKSKD